MNNRNFATITDLKEYINETMKLSSEKIFLNYLSKIYSNLLQREEYTKKSKSRKFSRDQKSILFLQKDITVNNFVPEKLNPDDFSLSLNTFLKYMDIQEFIGTRIFKYLNKSTKSNKLCKDDFCKGLNNLYYGSIKELINLTFNLSDFNDDGKIYSSDMNLILKYIPCSSEFFQKNYLKQINNITSKFFENLSLNNEPSEIKQLDFTTYQTYIQDYATKSDKQTDINSEFLSDYEFNAPFFHFISIVSYLFKNLPFSPKTVEFFMNNKKAQKIKLGIGHMSGLLSLRNQNQKLLTTERRKNIYKNMTNSKINSTFRCSATIGTNRFSYNPNDKMIKEALPKIGRTNLFNIKKSSSQIFLKKENLNKAILSINLNKNQKNKRTSSNGKHEFIIARQKDIQNKDIKDISGIFPQQEKSFIENNIIKRYNSKKKTNFSNNESVSFSTTKNSSFLLNQGHQLKKIFLTPEILIKKNNSNDMKEKFTNLKQKLPQISFSQQKYSPMIGISQYLKLKNEIKDDIEELEEFQLCEGSENDGSSNTNSLLGRDSNKSENIFQLNETYLYKYDDNDFHFSFLNKYYALLKEKEIIFFTSEQKNEFCDIWYINRSYISTGKEIIGKQTYYTINITYENNFIKKLYFLNESMCQSYSLSIKASIKDYNFYDYYDIMQELGEGHFGKVCKCKNKKTGDYFAVKIINKPKLTQVDLELIRQEKNYLQLIKHENIISLQDFFEDKQYIYFITEFYEGGDIVTYLEEKQKLKEKVSEKNCARIIRKIAQGIQYLNYFGIIHRDIKPENIMFARDSNIKTLKLIDLGVCKTLSYGETTKESIGTNGYISPEIYLHKEYSYKVDVWSLGVILYALVTGGILPFDDVNMDIEVIAKKVIYLKQDYPEEYFGDKSKKLIDILDKMLEKNEEKRIDIDSLLKDSWFDIIKK